MYRFNPGVGVAASANPNQPVKSITYSSMDTGARLTRRQARIQPGEEGAFDCERTGRRVRVDPNIKQPVSQQATAYVEQQITEGVGARAGFVYYTVNNQTDTFQTQCVRRRAYTVPFSVVDRGPGRRRRNGGRSALTFYGIPAR